MSCSISQESRHRFVLTSYNNEVYISARAIDEVNVQVMMERMGGGGHLNIAGAQVKDTMDETERMLKEIIDQLYQERGRNRNESNSSGRC